MDFLIFMLILFICFDMSDIKKQNQETNRLLRKIAGEKPESPDD